MCGSIEAAQCTLSLEAWKHTLAGSIEAAHCTQWVEALKQLIWLLRGLEALKQFSAPYWLDVLV